jgi:hypothetical protein
MLKRPAILFVGLLFAAVFVFGLVRLFELRLARGDIYPPYSSLRTDPLGASVFYESLQEVSGVSVQRYFEETFHNDAGRGRTLFVLGTDPYSLRLSRSEFNALDRFVYNGGRMVIAYFPEVSETWSSRRAQFEETNAPDTEPPHHKSKKLEDNHSNGTNFLTSTNDVLFTNNILLTNGIVLNTNTNSAGQTNSSESDNDEDWHDTLFHTANLSEKWGFDYTYKNLDTNDAGKVKFPDARLVAANYKLPVSFAIHTALCFTNLTNGWVTIYQRGTNLPVIVQRKLGSGSVVLVADSYPFSNEAMFKDRRSKFLAWALGSGRDAIFDEAHLGVVEQPGIASLMRRYRLHGLIFGLLLVAGLFIWKNSLSLVPPPGKSETEAGAFIRGRDSAAGFVNLLRRGISPSELINVCFAEWKKSSARQAAVSPEQRRDAEQIVQQQAAQEPRQRRPVESYRRIAEILKRRK